MTRQLDVVTVIGVRATAYAAVGQEQVVAVTPRVQALIDGGYLRIVGHYPAESHDVAPGSIRPWLDLRVARGR